MLCAKLWLHRLAGAGLSPASESHEGSTCSFYRILRLLGDVCVSGCFRSNFQTSKNWSSCAMRTPIELLSWRCWLDWSSSILPFCPLERAQETNHFSHKNGALQILPPRMGTSWENHGKSLAELTLKTRSLGHLSSGYVEHRNGLFIKGIWGSPPFGWTVSRVPIVASYPIPMLFYSTHHIPILAIIRPYVSIVIILHFCRFQSRQLPDSFGPIWSIAPALLFELVGAVILSWTATPSPWKPPWNTYIMPFSLAQSKSDKWSSS